MVRFLASLPRSLEEIFEMIEVAPLASTALQEAGVQEAVVQEAPLASTAPQEAVVQEVQEAVVQEVQEAVVQEVQGAVVQEAPLGSR
eukprot:gene19079-25679_t